MQKWKESLWCISSWRFSAGFGFKHKWSISAMGLLSSNLWTVRMRRVVWMYKLGFGRDAGRWSWTVDDIGCQKLLFAPFCFTEVTVYVDPSLSNSQKHREDSPEYSSFLPSSLLFWHCLLKVTSSANILVWKEREGKAEWKCEGKLLPIATNSGNSASYQGCQISGIYHKIMTFLGEWGGFFFPQVKTGILYSSCQCWIH